MFICAPEQMSDWKAAFAFEEVVFSGKELEAETLSLPTKK